MALGQIFLPVIRFSPVSIIPPMLHTHHIHVALTRGTNGRSLGTFQKQRSTENWGAFDIKVLSLSL